MMPRCALFSLDLRKNGQNFTSKQGDKMPHDTQIIDYDHAHAIIDSITDHHDCPFCAMKSLFYIIDVLTNTMVTTVLDDDNEITLEDGVSAISTILKYGIESVSTTNQAVLNILSSANSQEHLH